MIFAMNLIDRLGMVVALMLGGAVGLAILLATIFKHATKDKPEVRDKAKGIAKDAAGVVVTKVIERIFKR